MGTAPKIGQDGQTKSKAPPYSDSDRVTLTELAYAKDQGHIIRGEQFLTGVLQNPAARAAHFRARDEHFTAKPRSSFVYLTDDGKSIEEASIRHQRFLRGGAK
jgi:hypothetical protein